MSTLAQEERAFDCRCLPTLQLADAIWQVIFEELPADVAKYLQRQFSLRRALCRTSSASSKVSGLRHAAPRNFGCQVSAWVGILGTSPGSGGGTNPLEARRASWEAELKSRTRDGLLTALRDMQRLYSKWVTVFEWGKPLRMSAFSADENEYLLNSASLRSQGRSPAIDYWPEGAPEPELHQASHLLLDRDHDMPEGVRKSGSTDYAKLCQTLRL